MALAVKAEAIDNGLVRRQPEKTRPGIARLGPRRHRPDLDEAEAQAEERIGNLGILVVAGSQTERIGDMEAGDIDGQTRIRRETGARREARLQRPDRKTMRRLRIETEETGPDQRPERIHQAMPSGKS